MHQNENVISKIIVTPDGEKDFQLRYIRDENVGIITTQTDKAYFLLDSGDYWYDLIQEKYPPVVKCTCKNDRFHLTFDYTPRVNTEDFKEISITCSCTVCQKSKRLSPIKIDYSPSSQLFDQPITYCKQPKIKYKTYSLAGYWSDDTLADMAEYLLKKNLFVYCWYWDCKNNKRHFKELSESEMHSFLKGGEERYISMYFSEEPFDHIPVQIESDESGVFVPRDIWRKHNLLVLHGPVTVMSYGLFYHMEFCSESLDRNGNTVSKSDSFCSLVRDFQKYAKKRLKE